MAAEDHAISTERLIVRPLEDDDLEPVFETYASNPAYLELTEGSGGEPGRYDLEMLQRDVALARLFPDRWLAGIFLRPGGEAIGVMDWLQEHPTDGLPWLGLVMLHAARQRQGYGSEAFAGLAERLRRRGATRVRAAVHRRNEAGRVFLTCIGFEPLAGDSDAERVVLERVLV